MTMNYIVTPEWVLGNQADLVIVDVRFSLQDTDAGREAYQAAHIPGAFYLDLNQDLSSQVREHGGNHPLPDEDVLSHKLGEIGIDQSKRVVLYDATNDMFAARAWWLLHYLGHEAVYVMDGGLAAWEAAGFSVTDEIPRAVATTFVPKLRANQTATMEEVRAKQGNTFIIDSRAYKRYTGEVEPMYAKRGHIPGATNYFWQDVLDTNGKWKTQAALEEHFSKLDKTAEVIVSCGSGVSACPNIIALKMAGYENVKLYPGSFSDWITYPENEVITGTEA